DMKAVQLADVIAAAVAAVKPTADSKQIEIVTRLDPAGAAVAGDPSRLQQVAWNLLTNAVKFTLKGGRIEIALDSADAQARLIVRDNGRGIDPDFLPSLSERFRQADASASRQYGGLGIGLALVKELVELHGGSVAAESDGPGRGATFTVTLPL